MEIFKEYRKFVLKMTIKNPCLSEELDYKSNSYRYKIYKKELSMLNNDDLLNEVEFWADFINPKHNDISID